MQDFDQNHRVRIVIASRQFWVLGSTKLFNCIISFGGDTDNTVNFARGLSKPRYFELRNRLGAYYSLRQKKCTFNSDFFRARPEGGGPKILMVDPCEFFGPPSSGWPQKKPELNVRFFWHRLYILRNHYLQYTSTGTYSVIDSINWFPGRFFWDTACVALNFGDTKVSCTQP